jgi:hypothetical protein
LRRDPKFGGDRPGIAIGLGDHVGQDILHVSVERPLR